MIISIIRWIFAYFDEAAKLCKASNDADNFGGLLILQDLLNERVAKGDASNPHDFNLETSRDNSSPRF